ncbi:MAG: hypothetical protein GX320_03215 [Tissierellia bacterium]|nr:hypothetical protein [Tissierellia bacterium]
MAEVQLVIYASETRANILGKTITSKAFTLTQSQAVKIRDYYYKLDSQRTTAISIIAGVVAGHMHASVSQAFGVSIATAVPLTTYFTRLGKQFDTLALNMSKRKKVRFIYKWRGGGSKGAYWLTDVRSA